MTESQGNVRLICSLSLASCRLKAEALVRLLHNKLWSIGAYSTGGKENNKDDCDRLIKENIFKTESLHVVDKPPKPQIYGANDVNEHHWKHTMHADEEDELYDTPNCSSPPSPAEEEILVNPPVYVTLPGVCALSHEQYPMPCRDPLSSQSFGNDGVECSSSFCKLGGITLKEKAIICEKLQKYASVNCSCIDEGVETFYDADSDDGEHSSHPSVDSETHDECDKSTTSRTGDLWCSLLKNESKETHLQSSSQITQETEQSGNTEHFKENLLSENKNEQIIEVTESSPDSVGAERCVNEEGVAVGEKKQNFSDLSAADDYETKENDLLDAIDGLNCGTVAVNEDVAAVNKKCDATLRSGRDKCDDQETEFRKEPALTEKQDCLMVRDDDRPMLLRSTSLKTGKTPPGTPRRKKIVRFADALGLDLEAVRHIVMDDLPVVPPSAYTDLSIPEDEKAVNRLETAHSTTSWNSSTETPPITQSSCQSHHTLCPLFQQPAADPNFLNRVRTQKVCVENVLVSDFTVHCIVRVLNIGYEKMVMGRYSINDWASYEDVLASYVPGSCDGFSDKFAFNLFLPYLSDGQKLTFAVCYSCCGQDYWDNNDGNNYSLRYHNNVSMLPSPEDGPSWLHHFI